MGLGSNRSANGGSPFHIEGSTTENAWVCLVKVLATSIEYPRYGGVLFVPFARRPRSIERRMVRPLVPGVGLYIGLYRYTYKHTYTQCHTNK